MALNILAALSDQHKSWLTKHYRRERYGLPCFILPSSPLRRSKALMLENLCKQSSSSSFFFFNTLITSCSCLAKTIPFNCLISPSHYSIQYFLYWRQAAYRAQLYRSVLVMVRHACAERRQRGKAAGHSVGLRCGIPSRSVSDSREISFHDSLTCLQSHISEGTTCTKL